MAVKTGKRSCAGHAARLAVRPLDFCCSDFHLDGLSIFVNTPVLLLLMVDFFRPSSMSFSNMFNVINVFGRKGLHPCYQSVA